MAKCDLEARALTPQDKKRYDLAKTKGQKLATTEAMLKTARKDMRAVVKQVQAVYPGLVNNKGEFLEDIAARQYDKEFAAAQFSLPLEGGRDTIGGPGNPPVGRLIEAPILEDLQIPATPVVSVASTPNITDTDSSPAFVRGGTGGYRTATIAVIPQPTETQTNHILAALATMGRIVGTESDSLRIGHAGVGVGESGIIMPDGTLMGFNEEHRLLISNAARDAGLPDIADSLDRNESYFMNFLENTSLLKVRRFQLTKNIIDGIAYIDTTTNMSREQISKIVELSEVMFLDNMPVNIMSYLMNRPGEIDTIFYPEKSTARIPTGTQVVEFASSKDVRQTLNKAMTAAREERELRARVAKEQEKKDAQTEEAKTKAGPKKSGTEKITKLGPVSEIPSMIGPFGPTRVRDVGAFIKDIDASFAPLIAALVDMGFPSVFSHSAMAADHLGLQFASTPYISFILSKLTKTQEANIITAARKAGLSIEQETTIPPTLTIRGDIAEPGVTSDHKIFTPFKQFIAGLTISQEKKDAQTEEAKTKAGPKKSGAEKVSGKKQTGSTPTLTTGGTQPAKSTKSRETKSKVQELKDKGIKTKDREEKTPPPKQAKPQPVKREEQQPVSVSEPVSKKATTLIAEGRSADDIIDTLTRPKARDLFVETLETTKSIEEFRTAAEGILIMAFFDGNTDKHAQAAIDLAYGADLLWTPGEPYDASIEAFLSLVHGESNPTYVTLKGKVTPWAAFALKRGLIPQAHKVAKTAPTGADKNPEIAKLIKGVTNDADVARDNLITAVDDVSATPAALEVTAILGDIEASTSIEGVGYLEETAARESLIAELQFKGMTKEEKAFQFKNVPLSQWFSKKGKIKWKPLEGHPGRVVLDRPQDATPTTTDQLKDADAPPREGKSSRYDGPVITKPMSLGSVRTQGSRILKKFNRHILPEVKYYSNLADLERRDPKLLAEANKSRTDGQLIPSNASGYSFGNTVLIFSENIKHRHHLAFVLSHEIIGHFGLGSLMQTPKFNRLMDDIYKTDAMVRADADILIDLHGMSKREATEEALADLAGVLDSSILARIVEAIRTFFRRLRLDHTDDMTRYFIHHSRRYVRTGSTSDVSAVGVYANFKTLEERHIEGRGSAAHALGGSYVTRNTTWMPSINGTFERLDNAVRRIRTREGLEANRTAISKLVGLGLEQVQSLSNIANRSPGVRAIATILREESEDIRRFLSITDEKMRYSFTADLFGLGKGPSKLEIKQASELAGINALNKAAKAGEEAIDKAQSLIRTDVNGMIIPDERVFDPALPKSSENINGGIIKAKAFAQDIKLGDYDFFDAITNTKLREDIEAGKINLPLIDTDTGELQVDKNGNPVVTQYKPDFLVNGKIPENVWRIHNELRNAVDAAAITTMITKIEGTQAQKDRELELLGTSNPNLKPEDGDIDTLRDIADIYAALYNEGAKLSGAGLTWVQENQVYAELFLREVTRALHEKLKLSDWVNGNPNNINQNTGLPEGSEMLRNDARIKPIISKLTQLHNRNISEESASKIWGILAQLHTLSGQATNAEFYAKRSIMAAYVHFGRRGKLQISVRVREVMRDEHGVKSAERGPPIKLAALLDNNLTYIRTDSEGAAKDTVKKLNEELKFNTPVKMADTNGVLKEVELYATIEEAATRAPLLDTINYDEFIQTLLRVNINISPQERKRLVQTLASSHSSARSNLMRSGTPGWDPDMVRSTAEHLERQAHIAGKNRHNHRIAEIMADRTDSLWFGDQDNLNKLVELLEIAEKSGNEHKIFMAKKALAEYQHQMLHSSGSDGFQVKQRDGTFKTVKGLGKGNRYKDVAADVLAFRNQNPDTMVGLDSRIDKIAGPMMEWTALVQLGLALAPGMVNLTSIITHAGPMLATYNPKTGYGGGYGLGPSYVALAKAGRNMAKIGLGNVAPLQKIVTDGTWAQHGMEGADEAQFLLNETLSGVLTPNMTNMLVGTSRAGRHSNNKSKAIAWGMTVFSKSEQYNRRVTAIAAYRLEKKRMIASGKFVEEDFHDSKSLGSIRLASHAVTMVNTSQGEYAAYNRPAWARSGIGKVLFTYKLFVVITIELMANLAHKEKLFFLGMLIFMSGIKGLPFADDLFDLIDTLKQKFGLKANDAEIVVAQFFDNLYPGMAGRIAMRGVFDYIFGTTGSTRFGHGDLIPGSGMFKAGSDAGRELKNIAGPVASAYSGIISSTALTAKYLAETVGLRADTTTFTDIARQGFGSAGIKGLTDGFVYLSNGSITNARGQLVSKEVGISDVVFRMLGFYPGIATRHNDVTRLSQSAREYTREIKATFINAGLIAAARGDTTGVIANKKSVREWNKNARGTEFFIPNYPLSLSKAISAAKRTTSQRQLKSLPRSTRPLQKELMKIYGLPLR